MIELPPERPGHEPPAALKLSRDGTAKAIAAGIWRTAPAAQEVFIAGVRALRFSTSAAPRATILHFHGGGYRLGCPEMIGPFAMALAERCGVEVICPAYRLAPEHPFPAGLTDARNIFLGLLASGTRRIIVSGDSAGGGLAASLTALSVAMDCAPAALILLSAWLDLTVTSQSYEENAATDKLFSRNAAMAAAELYLQGLSPQSPLTSPLLGPVAGLPPTFISAGTGEVLRDDSRRFYAALRAAGVTATLCEVPDMEHVAVTRDMALPGAAETFKAVSNFITLALGPD